MRLPGVTLSWSADGHDQSTVSGGGYIGAFLQGLVRRRGFDGAFRTLAPGNDDASAEATPGTQPSRARNLSARRNDLSPSFRASTR